MSTSAECITCGETATVPSDGPAVAFLLPFAAHAGKHQTPHHLEATVPQGSHTLELACLAPNCRSRPVAVTVQCAEAFAAVHALAFHSYHEGHTLSIKWDGVEIHSAWRDREGRPTESPQWNPPL